MWKWLAAALVVGVAGFALWVRVAPSDPGVWHVDPLAAERPGRANHHLMRPGEAASPVWDMTAAELMAALDAVALAEPRVVRLAGTPEEGFVTYVARSRLWGFPDYVSVRALEVEGGAALAAFSRARFGESDLGVNAARMARWLAALPAPRG